MTKTVPVVFERVCLVDDDMVEELSAFSWYISINAGKPYARRHTQKSRPVGETWMHRYIVNCPPGLIVHHINGNTLDNRRINLKIMTRDEHDRIHNRRK